MSDYSGNLDLNSIESFYTTIHKDILSESLIGIATLIAVIVILKKFINAYKEAFSDSKPADVKHFFNLFHIYIYSFAIVSAAPAMFTVVEKGLGKMQTEYISKYSGDLDMAVDDAVKKYEQDYIQDDVENSDDDMVSTALSSFWARQEAHIYKFFLFLTKYVFNIFVTGRYLYLLLLQIVTPLAIVSFLDDSLKQYGMNYLKHLLICYLMVPAFLLANKFGVELGKTFIENLNKYSLIAIFMGFIFKLGLLKKAQSYLERIL